jgi:hypothetical protein
MSARVRRGAAWLALVAVLGFALLPTLSRAMAFAADSPWTEICTPQGMKWVAADAAADAAGEGAPTLAAALDHCALCAMAGDATAVLHCGATPGLLPPASAQAPATWRQAALAQRAWRSAQPRGPPSRA